jgi:threonyl-tRNA synthetase
MKKGQKAMWPLWLAPTQVRFIPVSEKYVEAATALMQDIPFRADLDDRDLSLGKRIRGAEKEWVPYIVVIGEDEKESGKLTVRVRGGGNKQESWTPEELTTVIREQVGDKPYERLPLPVHLSRRPIFVG